MCKDEILNNINLKGYVGDHHLKITAKYVRMIVEASLKTKGLNKTYTTGRVSDIEERSENFEEGFEGKEFTIKYHGLFSKPIYALQLRRDKKYVNFAKQEIRLTNKCEIQDDNLTKIISSTLDEFGFKLK